MEANSTIELLLASGAATLSDDLLALGNAANIRIGTNPPFELQDFFDVYPQFQQGSPNIIPEAVLNMYVTLAGSCIQQARWLDAWQFGMCLFIAHYCTLYLMSKTTAGTAQGVANAGLVIGVAISKSAGDVSVSRQILDYSSSFMEWGAFNLTLFGQQLIQIAELVGMGGMVVW
jgi:hypothetical protein